MIVYGFAKDVKYAGDGTMYVKVRIPAIHGPNDRNEYRGHMDRNYVWDKDLPYYQANILASVPVDGDILELKSPNEGSTDFIVSGITGSELAHIATNYHPERNK